MSVLICCPPPPPLCFSLSASDASFPRLIKEFDREVKDLQSRNDANTNKMLNEKKQSMVCLLYSYFIES